MAKTKQKGTERPKDSTARVEDKLVEISSEISKAAKDYRVPIIVGVVVVVGIIGLFALVRTFEARATKKLNGEFASLMQGNDAQIRADYPAFLAKIEGDDFEPFAVGRICGWLVKDGTPEGYQTALGLAQAAAERHKDDPVIQGVVTNYQTVQQEDSTFEAPVPPSPVEASTSAGETPGLTPPTINPSPDATPNSNSTGTIPTPSPDSPSSRPSVEAPKTESSSTTAPVEVPPTPNPSGTPKTTSAPAGNGG